MTSTIEAIRQRLDDRRKPQIGTCGSCGYQREMASPVQTMPSSLAIAQWRCEKCGGQISVTMTIGGDAPSADEDIQTLLALVAPDRGHVFHLRQRVKHQRLELRRLSRAIERQTLYMREQAHRQTQLLERTRAAFDRYVHTTCPWCSWRRQLKYPSIHGWWRFWFHVRYRFWWQVWAGPRVAAARAYDAGVRETLTAFGQPEPKP